MFAFFNFKIKGFIIFCFSIKLVFASDSTLTDVGQLYQQMPGAYTYVPQIDFSVQEKKMNIHYKKANEIGSLVAGYLTQKIDMLKNLKEKETYFRILSGGMPGPDSGQMENLLSNFCDSHIDFNLLDCADRYIFLATPIILRTKSMMQSNMDHSAKLDCTQRNDQGTCRGSKGQAVSVSSKTQRTNYFPLLPTYQDLQKYAAQKKIAFSAENYKKWIQQALQDSDEDTWVSQNWMKPDKSQFAKTRQVKKSDGSTEMEYVQSADGSLKYDEPAYQLAIENWKHEKDAIQGMLKRMQDHVEHVPEKVQKARQEFINTPTEPPPAVSTNAGLYAGQRRQLVDLANQEMSGKKSESSASAGNLATGLEQIDPRKSQSQITDQDVIFSPSNFDQSQLFNPKKGTLSFPAQ